MTYGQNMVILAWTGDELSRGQVHDYHTHRRRNRQTQATTIPEGQNWPRVKTRFDSDGNCFQNGGLANKFPKMKTDKLKSIHEYANCVCSFFFRDTIFEK